MPEQHVATCRMCGAICIEDATDPGPGLCPRCFDDELQETTRRICESAGMPEGEIEALMAKLRST